MRAAGIYAIGEVARYDWAEGESGRCRLGGRGGAIPCGPAHGRATWSPAVRRRGGSRLAFYEIVLAGCSGEEAPPYPLSQRHVSREAWPLDAFNQKRGAEVTGWAGAPVGGEAGARRGGIKLDWNWGRPGVRQSGARCGVADPRGVVNSG
ncbi:hypothetical protein NL676_016869 [Syzygium grande]|nr:hypothetical protein NL676_016869 [Syzygium grande]